MMRDEKERLSKQINKILCAAQWRIFKVSEREPATKVPNDGSIATTNIRRGRFSCVEEEGKKIILHLWSPMELFFRKRAGERMPKRQEKSSRSLKHKQRSAIRREA